jgi:chemotaxis signal transduction protein
MKQMTIDDLRAAWTGLRDDFDASFRAPLHDSAAIRHRDLLAIRVADAAYALQLTEVTGLHGAAKITRVPSAVPEFLGLLGVRGLLVPVYDLALLLGYHEPQALRWVAQVRAEHPVGLAFPVLDGHFRVPVSAPSASAEASGGHVREAVRLGPALHSIVDVSAVLSGLSRGTTANATKERDR